MRISREEMLMQVALVVAQRGTCDRLQVGAVISRDGRIIVTGYNGAPAGLPHCNHAAEPIEMTVSGCQQAEHAERNAIAFAARYGLALDQSELFCTHAPCANCARSIINAGIKSVTYVVPYRRTEGVELLMLAGIDVLLMEQPSGKITLW